MPAVRSAAPSSFAALALVLSGIAILGQHGETRDPPAPTAVVAPTGEIARANELIRRQPGFFVPNLGQWSHSARFVHRSGPMTVFLEDRGWTLDLRERRAHPETGPVAPGPSSVAMPRAGSTDRRIRGVALRMTFDGDASVPELTGETKLPGHHNYLLGNDGSRWRTGVPLHRAVRYDGLYPGIDLRLREADGAPEYDLLLQPGADLAQVCVRVEGGQGLSITDDGSLVVRTALGPVTQPVPETWQVDADGAKREVACGFTLLGADRFGFAAPGWDRTTGLTIDPGLIWSTYLGGSSGYTDSPSAVAVDAQGAVTVAGATDSVIFPTTPGAYDTTYNGDISDAYVARFSPTGSRLVYSTFLGGSAPEVANALTVDAQGVATVAGWTDSPDFPTTPGAFDTTYKRTDGFVTRLSASGSSLVYSTFLGGWGTDLPRALAVDAQGAATVAGSTDDRSFPTTPGAFDTTYHSNGDGFVARLRPDGSGLVYSTFLGEWAGDAVTALAVDAQGSATVAGFTNSANFPTTRGAFDTTFNGRTDAFVARLSPSGSALVYSTFLGGGDFDHASALALDAQGATTVVGTTRSSNFPTTAGAFDTTYNGWIDDAFVTRLSASGASLVYSTFIGGTNRETGWAVAVDARGDATVAGDTQSDDFPTTPGAFDRTHHIPSGFGGTLDAFVARLSASGASLVYSTFLGGTGNDSPSAVALDAQGAATVAGLTRSYDFPTTAGAFDTTFNPGFVARLDMLPTGVSAYGDSSPGCAGPLAASVTSMPRLGNGSFAVTCTDAPPNANGGILIGAAGLAAPVVVLGARIWVDPNGAFLVVGAVSSNRVGGADYALPIPQVPALRGARLFTQFAWVGPTAPPPCPALGVSASNALRITVQ